MDLKDQWFEGVDWIYLSWNTDRLLIFVRSIKQGSVLTGWETIDFQEGFVHGVISLVLVPDIWSLSLESADIHNDIWSLSLESADIHDIWSLSLESADIHNDIFSTDKNSIQARISDKTVGMVWNNWYQLKQLI
jgi:hypothetical protein